MKKVEPAQNTFSVVIVDDEETCIKFLKNYLNEDPRLKIVAAISDSQNAVEQIIKEKPDLLFLDVEMPGLSGIEILKELNQTTVRPFVIFVTAYDKYTIEAIRASAFDYILKPVSKAELTLSIERFITRFSQQNLETNYSKLLEHSQNRKIKFNTTGGFIMIDPDDIIYIQADWNYSEIHFGNNKQEVVVLNIGTIENLLPKGDFARINRSVIINLKYLEKVQRGKRLCYLKKDNETFTFKIPVLRIKNLEELL